MAQTKLGAENAAPEPKFAQELQNMQYEPLLPIEKKLIAWSLILGVVLIVLLAVLNKYLFPA